MIYGIIEPETRKIMYIDFYIDREDYVYKEDKVFLDDAIENMQYLENPYWRDLVLYKTNVKIVVLDILDNDSEICEITEAYRKLFKPKFNIINNIKGYD